MALIQFVYSSHLADESALQGILPKADENNKKNNITGMLLYFNGRLLQVLEGEDNTVRATFKRIQSDQRHHHVVELMDQQVPARDFSSFSIGFHKIDESELNDVPQYKPLLAAEFDIKSIHAKPSIALELLKYFATVIGQKS
jgi:Sensors of blue-light using FAD